MKRFEQVLKVAILDLYNGLPNQGMRCIGELLLQFSKQTGCQLVVHSYDVRQKQEIPDTSYQIYISSGGPGSPLETENNVWENKYFSLIHRLEENNQRADSEKKYAFFICHSFQLLCRHYQLAQVCQRKSTSFGVFPVHKYKAGFDEPVFSGITDPFYAVDSRDWQVIKPNYRRFAALGCKVLALEKERPHVPLERAIMAIRFSDYFLGTQFHPEADPSGMSLHLLQEEKKQQVIAHHGKEKYDSMLRQLNDPDKILLTQQVVIPRFLEMAAYSLRGG